VVRGGPPGNPQPSPLARKRFAQVGSLADAPRLVAGKQLATFKARCRASEASDLLCATTPATPLFQEPNKPRTTPTITGQLQRTIDELNRAAFELLEVKKGISPHSHSMAAAHTLNPKESYALSKVEQIQKSVEAECVEVWRLRYEIYKVNGLCFSDSDRVCRYNSENSVPLSVEDRAAIDRSVAAEQKHCRRK
jgi:hypothetical protein